MWVFGYGSLIWKVDFPFERKIPGYIKGFQRRFYQLSTDHRGTQDNPGRVVTLVPADESSRVYGLAYKIKNTDMEQVVDHLDYREKGGYERKLVKFYPCDETENTFDITIYLAQDDNFNYAGPAELSKIAKQIFKSVGPSGSNVDYIFNLAISMRTFFPNVRDDHLFDLEHMVKALVEKNIYDNITDG